MNDPQETSRQERSCSGEIQSFFYYLTLKYTQEDITRAVGKFIGLFEGSLDLINNPNLSTILDESKKLGRGAISEVAKDLGIS